MSQEERGVIATTEELVRARHPDARMAMVPNTKVQSRGAGPYDSTFRGRGMEFDETRMYQPGDDIRTIDWRVTARTGKVHTKLYHEERERPVLLLIDQRASMRFGTRNVFKSVQAARCAAMLAWAVRESGDRVGGVLLSGSRAVELRPQRSREGILALLRATAEATRTRVEGSELSLTEGLDRIERVTRPGTLVFVLSDFHDIDDATERALLRLSLRTDTNAVLIYDPLEESIPDVDDLRVSNGDRVLAVGTHDQRFRASWAKSFEERRERLAHLCQNRQMGCFALRTDEEPGNLLMRADFRSSFRRATRGGKL